MPSELCTDEQFIRRVYARHDRHAADAEAGTGVRRRQGRRRSATSWSISCSTRRSTRYFFANKWADILRVKRRQLAGPRRGHLRVPRLDSRGRSPPTSRTRVRPRRSSRPAATSGRPRRPCGTRSSTSPSSSWTTCAQVFLGLRLACANCHHHPYEKWSQDDYWGLAAFFGRVGRKEIRLPNTNPQAQDNRLSVMFVRPTGNVTNKRTQQAGRDRSRSTATPMDVAADEDPRQKLVDWMVDAEEPVLRAGGRQPLLGALLRPRHRRSARRHAGHQPAVEPGAARRPGRRIWSRTSTA